MANVFKQVAEPNNRVNVSNFDLSFQNNLTMQFGYLYPCFVKKFAPKTSVKIKPTFGLNFMPMMFPVQTRMRARMSFYKVRCRSVWKDYKDWFGNLKPGLQKPYINFNTEDKLKKMASTGSLGDYLGLPTTFPPLYGSSQSLPASFNSSGYEIALSGNLPIASGVCGANDFKNIVQGKSSIKISSVSLGSEGFGSSPIMAAYPLGTPNSGSLSDYKLSLSIDLSKYPSSTVSNKTLPDGYNEQNLSAIAEAMSTLLFFEKSGLTPSLSLSVAPSSVTYSYDTTLNVLNIEASYSGDTPFPELPAYIVQPVRISWDSTSVTPSLYVTSTLGKIPNVSSQFNIMFYTSSSTGINSSVYKNTTGSTLSVTLLNPDTSCIAISDIDLTTSPYFNSSSENKEKQLKIDASFYRAYEAIYNAYFRDIRNNPFILNGQPEYNVFIPSDEGGEDNNVYQLRRRNWEADFLTTAVPSPQQGRAPLVGITTYGDSGETQLAFTAEDGKKYAVTYDYNPEKGELENLAFQQLSDDAVIKEPRNMMDLVSSGISISDLRNVNAYTKFLELNMRKGYFYKDLVEGHFDTKVRYDELNMPEFIGGTAKDVFVNPVSQTVQTSQDGSYFGALGSYAGQASVSGQADNTISAYFDEETIVIGLISIVPVANYSQLLPKHFLHRELLDSYFPEFDNIGFQPVLYNEVCPIQAYNDNPDKLLDLFGYQRPWYDYVASVDETHGLFRTNLRNFLINRVFKTQPTLSEDFLLVDPEQVNDVFSVTETTDKILGQIWFDVQVKAPISRIAIPRLD